MEPSDGALAELDLRRHRGCNSPNTEEKEPNARARPHCLERDSLWLNAKVLCWLDSETRTLMITPFSADIFERGHAVHNQKLFTVHSRGNLSGSLTKCSRFCSYMSEFSTFHRLYCMISLFYLLISKFWIWNVQYNLFIQVWPYDFC